MLNSLREFTRFYIVAIVIGLLLFGATLYIYFEVKTRVDRRNQELFDLRSETAVRVIEKRLQDYIQILKGGQGLFNVTDTVTQQQWHQYVSAQQVNLNYPGILGIGYAAMLNPEEIVLFEQEVQRKAFSDFTIWPEGKRPQYSSIIYLEPLNFRNRKAIGYDMYSEPTRQMAMQRAIDSGLPSLSSNVTLVQEGTEDVQQGFLIYLPVYSTKNIPSSIEERNKQIQGFVYSPFRANDLILSTIGSRFAEFDIEIYSGEENLETNLLFNKEPFEISDNLPANRVSRSISKIGGNRWLFQVAAMPEFGYDTSFPPVILFGGLIISALISFVLISMADAHQSAYLKQVITDNATASLFILSKKGRCTFMNPAAEILTGYTFAELQNKDFHQYLHYRYSNGENFPRNQCKIVSILPTRTSLYEHEEVLYKRNGESFYASINSQPIIAKGKLIGHLLEVYDITAEKEAEEALHTKNKMLETLNTLGTNLSAELDLSKLLQRITNAGASLTNAQFGTLFYFEGSTVSSYEPANPNVKAFPLNQNDAMLQKLMQQNKLSWKSINGDENQNKVLSNAQLPSVISAPIQLKSGQNVGLMLFGHSQAGTFTQASADFIEGIAAQASVAIENSRLFETIQNKNRALTSTNNDLDSFVYSASHDLKAPVLNIEGLVRALENPKTLEDPERLHKIVSMIKLSVNRFKETIEALSQVAKTSKDIDDELEEIDLSYMLNNILESISSMITDSGATIVDNISCSGFRFSPAYTRSIIQNLVTNAIKYRQPQQPPHIIISCQSQKDYFLLKVEDNGLGIPQQHLPKLFTLFKRFHSHVEGSGVGLYLVRRILENNGGRIEVDSTVGQGTTFSLYFPKYQKK